MPVPVQCAHCGKAFSVPPSVVKPRNFCSRHCSSKTINSGHGLCKTKTYYTWASMLQRCTNPKNPRFASYGGRGIGVCEEWRDFLRFLSDMGERPKGMTLDRIDNNAGYSLENCRWADSCTQQNNTRARPLIAYEGKNYTPIQLARKFGIAQHVMSYRIRCGWPSDQLGAPVLTRLRNITRKPFEDAPEGPSSRPA